jgi:N-acetylmuramoyl-L-alanine amidase
MNIQDLLLTINDFSRCGKKLDSVKAIVMHWTGNPMASAKANRDFFENRKNGKAGYGSAHYIVGIDGEIIRCIPDNEIAYHVGSSQIDPKSGKIYTDYARDIFGKYAIDYKTLSPNLCTIGIEMCPVDSAGHYKDVTLESASELVSSLLKNNRLKKENITTHYAIVGWKDCPRLWVNQPELFSDFIKSIK